MSGREVALAARIRAELTELEQVVARAERLPQQLKRPLVRLARVVLVERPLEDAIRRVAKGEQGN